ncbi:Vasohibin-domain-containing protein [Phlyctochytrium arcticum]|nr:Vasohibin-domain-containing protein [Phlyctochytrium arcticum]
MDSDFPDGFTVEKWHAIVHTAHHRIMKIGAMESLISGNGLHRPNAGIRMRSGHFDAAADSANDSKPSSTANGKGLKGLELSYVTVKLSPSSSTSDFGNLSQSTTLTSLARHLSEVAATAPGLSSPGSGNEESACRPRRNVSNLESAAHAPIPKVPSLGIDVSISVRYRSVQNYLNRLSYNHLGTPFFPIRKPLPFRSLMRTAQQITRYALPIKCLEAAVLGMLLSAGWEGVDRITCSFKSIVADESSSAPVGEQIDEGTGEGIEENSQIRKTDLAIAAEKPQAGESADTPRPSNCSSNSDDRRSSESLPREVYRHMVLLLRHGDRWGAIGLSRRPDLMDKPLAFSSLQDLLMDYRNAYSRNNHRLLKAKIGLPVPHDTASNERIVWKYLTVTFPARSPDFLPDAKRNIERYIRGLRGG